MDETRDLLLRAFAFGSLHAALLVVALALAGLLSSAGGSTAGGAAIYLWLWLVSCATAWALLRDLDPETAPLAKLLGAAMLWGAAAGPAFLVGIVAVQALLARDPLLLVFLVFGSMFAVGIGAAAGIALALVDRAVLALTRRAARSP